MDFRFKDKILRCVDCGEEFVFTVSAQEYFAGRGFTEDPKRCKSCYMQLKRVRRRHEGEFVKREPREEEVFALPHDIDGNIDPTGNQEGSA